jgi:hypothetical protein
MSLQKHLRATARRSIVKKNGYDNGLVQDRLTDCCIVPGTERSKSSKLLDTTSSNHSPGQNNIAMPRSSVSHISHMAILPPDNPQEKQLVGQRTVLKMVS